MRYGTVKTSTLLIPKRRTLRVFGESVTDAEVDNFDELVRTGFIEIEVEQQTEKIGDAIETPMVEIAEGKIGEDLEADLSGDDTQNDLFNAMTDAVVAKNKGKGGK